ncbi:MAG: translesion DNA synthesis-associated protein ImuA [Pseudomonadota bacterium]
MSAALEQLLRHPAIWRGGHDPKPEPGHVATGRPELDAVLPGGGWPRGALTEILTDQQGIGELSLLLPALDELTAEGLWAAWVAPPMVPYAPALQARGCDPERVLVVKPGDELQSLWAAEQLLHTKATGAVLLWARQADDRRLRRLQLAAESGRAIAVIFRNAAYARQSSPAALRMALSTQTDPASGMQVDVLKCRGRLPARSFCIR